MDSAKGEGAKVIMCTRLVVQLVLYAITSHSKR